MKKQLAALAALTFLLPVLPAEANYSRPGGTRQETCYTDVYREEYIPGTREKPGRVRRWTERKAVPCDESHGVTGHGEHPPMDDNSCIEGSVLGGIAGAAAGAALSRDEGLWIGIPLGIVGGSMIGCQIDGG